MSSVHNYSTGAHSVIQAGRIDGGLSFDTASDGATNIQVGGRSLTADAGTLDAVIRYVRERMDSLRDNPHAAGAVAELQGVLDVAEGGKR